MNHTQRQLCRAAEELDAALDKFDEEVFEGEAFEASFDETHNEHYSHYVDLATSIKELLNKLILELRTKKT